MELLSSEVIKKYDYEKTKKKVDQFMGQFEENYFKYLSVLPPNITSHLSEIKVQMSNLSNSAIERYVLKRIEKENEFIEYLNIILKIVDNLTLSEQQFFKGIYFRGNKIDTMFRQFQVADRTFIKNKKSTIIKFALALNLAVLK